MAERRLPPGIYRRGQTYRVVVYAGRDPTTRRKRQVSGTAATLAEAKALRARLLLEVGGGHHQAGSLTVADLLGRWRPRGKRGEASPSSVARAQVDARFYILPRLGQVRLTKLGPDTLDRFYDQLVAGGGRGGRPLAPATVRRVHVTLHAALAQAVKWRWLAANPADQATPPPDSNRPVMPPEHEQVARLLVEAALLVDSDFAALLHVAAVTGARPAEVCALRWSHLDLERGEAAISRGIVRGPDGLVDRPTTKTGLPRRITLAAPTVDVLRGRLRRAKQEALAVGIHLPADAYVFSLDAAGGTPMRPHGAYQRFVRLCKALGLPGLRLYDLRHYAATSLLRGGVDVVEAAGRLGHDPRTLLARYAHYQPGSDRRAAELLAHLVQPTRERASE